MWWKKSKDTAADLKALVERIIANLGEPVTGDEQSQGWDTALKTRWHDWFIALDRLIVTGNDVPPGWGIGRAMDFDGVGRTPIWSQAMKVGRLLDQGLRY